MVNTGKHVRAVYLGDAGAIALSPKDTLLIDCSTIDVESPVSSRKRLPTPAG